MPAPDAILNAADQLFAAIERGDEAALEQMFDDGIEPSDDPVLRFRTLVYSASVKLRSGVDRGPEAPAT